MSVDTRGGLRSRQVAAQAGVNVQTLRYYERRGLLDEPDRTLGGHRVYSTRTVTVLRVIKDAQRLGFTLDEVVELLKMGQHRRTPATSGLAAHAKTKLAEVESKVADLQLIADTLQETLTAGCDELLDCEAQPGCPIPFEDLQTGHEGT